MEKYEIIKITKDSFGIDVKLLGTQDNTGPLKYVTVYGMNDVRLGDKFYILQDRHGLDLAYVCRDNLWLKRIPHANFDYSVQKFAGDFRGINEFSLERWRYRRALKRAVKKLGMNPTNDAANNLRLWMSKMIVR